MSKDDKQNDFEILREEITEVRCGALNVHVDFLDLLELVGEEQAYFILGKLKDLLG